MRKHWFVIGGALLIMAIFLGCGGGNDCNTTIICSGGTTSSGGNTPTCVTYVTENVQLNLAELNAWSDNGAIWKEESREGDVFQDGKAENFQLEWDFPIKNGDQITPSFEGKVTGGGEVLVRIVSKIDGKTKTIYAEQKFSFSSGKNTIPTLTVANTDNQAKFIMMLGKKAGRYQFLTQIAITKKRIKADAPQKTTIDISKCEFSSDSRSLWDPGNQAIEVRMGSQRASTKLRCSGVPIKAGVNKITLTGYALPANNIVIQIRSSSDQPFGERLMELHGENITVEIISPQADSNGILRFLFGLAAGKYQLQDAEFQTE